MDTNEHGWEGEARRELHEFARMRMNFFPTDSGRAADGKKPGTAAIRQLGRVNLRLLLSLQMIQAAVGKSLLVKRVGVCRMALVQSVLTYLERLAKTTHELLRRNWQRALRVREKLWLSEETLH